MFILGSRCSELPINVNWTFFLFFARCYGWGATRDYRFKIGDFAAKGASWRGRSPTNHSFYRKTRLNGLSYGIKLWTDFSSVLSQFTRLTDRQTDRIQIARPFLIPCSAVKWFKTFVVGLRIDKYTVSLNWDDIYYRMGNNKELAPFWLCGEDCQVDKLAGPECNLSSIAQTRLKHGNIGTTENHYLWKWL